MLYISLSLSSLRKFPCSSVAILFEFNPSFTINSITMRTEALLVLSLIGLGNALVLPSKRMFHDRSLCSSGSLLISSCPNFSYFNSSTLDLSRQCQGGLSSRTWKVYLRPAPWECSEDCGRKHVPGSRAGSQRFEDKGSVNMSRLDLPPLIPGSLST